MFSVIAIALAVMASMSLGFYLGARSMLRHYHKRVLAEGLKVGNAVAQFAYEAGKKEAVDFMLTSMLSWVEKETNEDLKRFVRRMYSAYRADLAMKQYEKKATEEKK